MYFSKHKTQPYGLNSGATVYEIILILPCISTKPVMHMKYIHWPSCTFKGLGVNLKKKKKKNLDSLIRKNVLPSQKCVL